MEGGGKWTCKEVRWFLVPKSYEEENSREWWSGKISHIKYISTKIWMMKNGGAMWRL